MSPDVGMDAVRFERLAGQLANEGALLAPVASPLAQAIVYEAQAEVERLASAPRASCHQAKRRPANL
jgi:hypothetical protein